VLLMLGFGGHTKSPTGHSHDAGLIAVLGGVVTIAFALFVGGVQEIDD
jgi:hypothetical protein